MVVDFSKIDINERPVLVLKTLNGQVIQTLGYAYNLKCSFHYNEVSEISFDVPAFVDGSFVPNYDKIVGMTMVDMIGYGQFILCNPSVNKNGIEEIKHCEAYSLEYEFTRRKMSLESGTYNFWNPAAPDNTILGIIKEYMPDWMVGTVDNSLIGKYRTFEEDDVNIYNFIKSTVQQTYGCIFNFDTYNRKINVRAVTSDVASTPVFLSLENLIKEIEVEEDTENIFTCLDVSGADGVTIRSVNPTGTNKIYNLDYFMNATNFPQSIIDKWEAWKTAFQNNKLPYFSVSMERALKTSELLTERAYLTDLQGELKSIDNLRSVCVQAIAEGIDRNDELSDYNRQMRTKEAEIKAQQSVIDEIIRELETIAEELAKMNKSVSFEAFFSDDELAMLRPYIKEDSIQDSSFVAATVNSYTASSFSDQYSQISVTFSDGDVTDISNTVGKDLFSVARGNISVSYSGRTLTAEVVRGSFERKNNGDSVISVYLGQGRGYDTKTGEDITFPKGCLSIVGTVPNLTYDTSVLRFSANNVKMYVTKNTTEYEQRSIEWDLLEYGMECLNQLAYPSYTFKIDSANFLALNEFLSFTQQLTLGQRNYVDFGDIVMEPIFIGAEIDFEDISSLSLEFGDKYSSSDSAFSLADLLNKSISMGKSVDFNRFNYNSFIDSGASTSVRDFMTSALDVAKNSILSSSGQGVTWDESGLHLRKYTEDRSGYEPEQIWMINNSIVFTDDNWDSAKMAIGKFTDSNAGTVWGIVAPSIVGTLLAGENLIIESVKKDGGVSVFKVDGDGAVLHNAKFDITNGITHIMLDPVLGIGIGDYPVVTTVNGVEQWNENNAKFWADTQGNLHFAGTLEGCKGLFSGALEVGGETGLRVDDQGNLSIGGTKNNPNFYVSADGNMNARNGTFKGNVDASSMKIGGKNVLTNTTGSDNTATSNSKISADYLELRGITIRNSNGDTSFAVSDTGAVTINGNITMGSGSTINWSQINESNYTQSEAYKRANSAYNRADDALDAADDAYDKAVSASVDAAEAYDIVSGWQYNGTTYIDGRKLMTDTVMASHLIGGEVILYDNREREAGSISLSGASSAEYAVDIHSNAAMRLESDSGNVYLCAAGRGFINIMANGEITVGNAGGGTRAFMPASDNDYALGWASIGRWRDIYAVNTTITNSDRNMKKNIEYDIEKYKDFYMRLRPTQYKFIDNTSDRYHIGFISQDVEQALVESGLTSEDFAGFIKSPVSEDVSREESDYSYGLRYGEFIALNTHMIQNLYREIEDLKQTVTDMKG